MSNLFRSLLLASCLLGLCEEPAYGEAVGSEAAVKVAFLYNFFKFIDWPENAPNTDAFHLCTSASENLGGSLAVLERKTLKDRAIVLKRHLNPQAMKDCHMVYIDSADNVDAILQALTALPVVTVSETNDFIDRGGMIGLHRESARFSFSLNLAAAKASHIHISAQLLKLAKEVRQSQ
ncbi:MAG: hypothetical protein Kow0065_20140 [Methylomicrobium sp.]